MSADFNSESESDSPFVPPAGFGAAVARWQKKFGRHNLPWQAEADPYKIWLAEVMLQQTQVAAAVPYFQKFVARFPDAGALARASESAVLAQWSGLGYYARARNLHRAAQVVARNGFPQSAGQWAKLPGVGRSTANAVAVFALGARVPILDGNVKRVAARLSAHRAPTNRPESLRRLWAVSESLVPKRADIRAFTQGMMDLGATVCLPRAPLCEKCPAAKWCRARALNIAKQLPAPAQKTPRQTRTVSVSIIRHRGKILLERRPSRGVWGGLLAPPTVGRRECESKFHLTLSPAGIGIPPVIHDFTHFRMVMNPRLMQVEAKIFPPKSPGPEWEWVGLRELESAPLPAPIRREIPNWLKYAAERGRKRRIVRKKQAAPSRPKKGEAQNGKASAGKNGNGSERRLPRHDDLRRAKHRGRGA